MCTFSAPKAPPPVAIPEVPVAPATPQAAPQESDPAVQQTRENERKRKQQQAASSTLVTGGQGLTSPAATGLKTAFGA